MIDFDCPRLADQDCGTCTLCVDRYPSVGPQVPSQERLRLLLGEVRPPQPHPSDLKPESQNTKN